VVITEQARSIEELTSANAGLVERVTALERILGRNSGNSSMSPSSDDLPGRKKPRPRPVKGSGRERGKQNGAPGSSLPWVANPDEHVAHRPDGGCVCGADLEGATEVGIDRSHQVHDLPEVHIRVCQHDVYRVRCGCGREHVAALPTQVSAAPSSYGVDVKSLVVYLLVYQHVPVERVVELIADLAGGAGPAGRKRYVLSASTELYSLFHLGGRDLGSFTDFGVLPAFTGIAVHDRYCNYYNLRWKNLGGHQACTAHLLRDFTDAAEAHPAAVWPEQAGRALRGLIHAWNQARDTDLPDIPSDIGDPLIGSFRHAIRVGLSEVKCVPGPRNSTRQLPGRDLLEFCRDRETDVLRFCSDTRVWSTNNISERDLRPTKTQQKISGRLTSEVLTQDRLDIRSYIDTLCKHGANVMSGIRAALTANSWRPPTLAPT